MHIHPSIRLIYAAAMFQLTLQAAETNVRKPSPSSMLCTNIPPVIVEASRSFKSADQIAAGVTVIQGDEIAKRNRRDIVDVLRKDAGIFIRSLNSNPAQSQISMRGFGASSHGRVLVMVDGERLNNPDMSAPNLLRVPLDNIDRIEVLHGSQSVLYGDYAEAGVVNIVTLNPGETKTTLKAAGGSHNSFAAGVHHFAAIDEQTSGNAGAEWSTTDGYRRNGEHESWNLNAAVTRRWEKGRELSLSSFYHKSWFGLPGSLSYAQFQKNPKLSSTPGDNSTVEQLGARLHGRSAIGNEGTLDLTLSISGRDSETDWRSTGGLTEYDIESYALALKYATPWEVLGFENQLTLGVDSRLDRCEGYNHFAAISGLSPAIDRYWQYDRTALAGYVTDEFFITEKFSLLAGVRGESFRNRIKGAAATTTTTAEEYSYEGALLYRPLDKTKLFVRAVRYYHAPFVDEVIDTYSGIPDTTLETETGSNLEAGGSIELLDHLTASLTVFHMETEDEIYYDTRTYRNVNAPDDTERDGVEASMTMYDDQIGSLGLIYSYVQARFSEGRYEDNRIPMVPRQTIQLNGELNLTDEITLLATISHVDSQRLEGDFDNNAPRLLKPYTTLDLGVSYTPLRVEGLRLFAGVDNVFDKEYANYGGYFYTQWDNTHNYYYYPSDARTWKLAASYTF